MYVRDLGSGPFVHILGEDWPFLREIQKKVERGIYGTDGIQEMYQEIHDMLPVRYRDAPDARAAAKSEWMRNYVNNTIDEYSLPQRFKITFAPRNAAVPSLTQRLRIWGKRVLNAISGPI